MRTTFLIPLVLASITVTEAQGVMLKCKNERGQIEYRNTTADDPSCTAMSRATVPSSFPQARIYLRVGMLRQQVIERLGQPKAKRFREQPEGRVEAWAYENGMQVGFKGDTLVWIEGPEIAEMPIK